MSTVIRSVCTTRLGFCAFNSLLVAGNAATKNSVHRTTALHGMVLYAGPCYALAHILIIISSVHAICRITHRRIISVGFLGSPDYIQLFGSVTPDFMGCLQWIRQTF